MLAEEVSFHQVPEASGDELRHLIVAKATELLQTGGQEIVTWKTIRQFKKSFSAVTPYGWSLSVNEGMNEGGLSPSELEKSQ